MSDAEDERVYIDLGPPGVPAWKPAHRIPRPPDPQSDPGVELPFDAEVVTSPELTVSLTSPLHLYPIGVHLSMDWRLRRVDDRFDEMHTLLDNFSRVFRVPLPSDLLPTITVDDGDRVVSSQVERPAFSDERPNIDAALIFTGCNWSRHGDDDWQYRVGLWLWPLPPARTLTFRMEWPSLAVTGTPVRLDGAIWAN